MEFMKILRCLLKKCILKMTEEIIVKITLMIISRKDLLIFTYPKLNFFKNISYKKPKILDVGCGGGHFVFAGLMKGCDIKGIDVSKKLIQFGNNQIFNHTKEKQDLVLKAKTICTWKLKIVTLMFFLQWE